MHWENNGINKGWFGVLNLDRQQTSVFLILISIIIVLTGILFTNNNNSTSIQLVENGTEDNNNFHLSEDDKNTTEAAEEVTEMIKIYITGQVKKPGVIEVEEGSRLIDAIELAGGLLDDADMKKINLALKVQDEGMYIIPRIGEEIDGELNQGMVDTGQSGGKVNINRATAEELETLHGIGPAKAKAIIDYREKHGPFKAIDEIKNVSGIGEKTFEKLQDSITIK